MESSDGEEWRKEEDEDGEGCPRKKKKSSAAPSAQNWSCTECQISYTDKESYITHMAKQHRKVSGV